METVDKREWIEPTIGNWSRARRRSLQFLRAELLSKACILEAKLVSGYASWYCIVSNELYLTMLSRAGNDDLVVLWSIGVSVVVFQKCDPVIASRIKEVRP